MKVIFTKGLQASGKSSWCKEFVKEHKDYRIVNRDSFRHMLDGYSFSKETEELVTILERNAIRELLNKDYNVIIDKMNLNEIYLNKDIEFVKNLRLNVEVEIREFPVTLMEAIDRDSNREFSVGKQVIKNTWNKYEIELKQMIKRHKPKQIIDDKLPWCLICDIDGTLSDSTNRKIFDDSHAIEDMIIEPVRDILFQYASSDMTIFIMSGRKETCREITEQWLEKNSVPYDDLYMRKADDNRDDTIIKRELYEKYIKGRYNVLFILDDRPKVCKMWQDLGIFTLVVNQDVYAKNDF